MMALTALQAHLTATFYAPASAGFDATIRLAIGEQSLVLRVAEGELTFTDTLLAKPDATFYFDDVDIAWALLPGQADAISAFMAGQFRADGYLMWAFALMAMFRSASLPQTPLE